MTRNIIPTGVRYGGIGALAGLMLALSGVGLAAQNGEAGQTTADGVFTEAQAETGEETFEEVCAACHFSRQFRGRFMSAWTGGTVFSLYQMIQQSMPYDRPGSLSPQQYTDVVAYLLEINGMPTGDSPLPPDEEALKNVLIERSQNR